MADFPTHDDVTQASLRSGLGQGASELHGALMGWLAGGGADDEGWLASVLADPQQAAPVKGEVLDQLRIATAAELEEHDFGLTVLLPDTDASLSERAAGLFEWCRGFLGGFGLAGGSQAGLSEEAAEALDDLARLAQAAPEESEDEAEDEDALAEIEEFVRVAVLLLHGDCVLAKRHRQRLN